MLKIKEDKKVLELDELFLKNIFYITEIENYSCLECNLRIRVIVSESILQLPVIFIIYINQINYEGNNKLNKAYSKVKITKELNYKDFFKLIYLI